MAESYVVDNTVAFRKTVVFPLIPVNKKLVIPIERRS